jgi:ribosomal protein L19E
MTAENIFAWIEKFKSEHVEIRSGKVSKFKSAITKEVVKELIDRVRLWISVHDAKSSVQRWKQFETDLRMAYNGTFI